MAKATNNDKERKQEAATVSCVYLSYTSCHFTHDGKHFSLHNNESYQLPDCAFVQSLIGQGKLVVKK